MSHAITKIEARQLVKSIDDLTRVSDLLAKSGYFTDAKDAAQAGVKVLAGLEMGIGAFSAMAGIHVIKGKPSIGAGLMAAAVKRSGKYNYRVTTHTNTECVIDFYEHGDVCGTSSFSVEDAKAAGLAGSDNWRKAPRNMLFARALSNGVRWYCPDVFDTSTYVPEELGADVDDEGNIIQPKAAPTVTIIEPTPVNTTRTEPVIDAEVVRTQPAKTEGITSQQVGTIMRVFEIAGINPRTQAGKEAASDLLSHILNEPVTTMRGMTAVQASTFIGAFMTDAGDIDEDEVRAIALETIAGQE